MGLRCGCGAGEEVSVRKRFAAVDVEGDVVEIVITGADVSDNAGGSHR